MSTRGLVWTGLVMSTWLLTACSGGPRLPEAPPVPQATRAFAGATLTYVGDAYEQGRVLDEALASRFEKDTGVRVQVVPRPLSTSHTFFSYQHSLPPGGFDPDVVLIDVVWVTTFAEHLRDLGPALGQEAKAHWSPLIQNNTVNHRLVAMPLYLDGGLLFYRKDLLERYGFAGPPTTWEELERMAAVIQAGERQHDPDFQGFLWPGHADEGLTCNAYEWQASFGSPLVERRTGAFAVDNPRAIAAFRRATGWVGTISPGWGSGLTDEDTRHVFEKGGGAFMRNWANQYGGLQAEGSPVRGRFAVAPLPHAQGPYRSASTLGGWQLAVSAYTKQPDAAIAFVRYMASEGVQSWRAEEASLLPTRPALYRTMKQAWLREIESAMPSMVARPSNILGDRYAEISQIYYTGVTKMLRGEHAAGIVRLMAGDMTWRLAGWTPDWSTSELKPGVFFSPPWTAP